MAYVRLAAIAVLVLGGLAKASARTAIPYPTSASAGISPLFGGSRHGACNKPCACDNTPPAVTVADILEIGPPNHKHRTLQLSDCVAKISDDCDVSINLEKAGQVLSIYSDEPEDAIGRADGSTRKDIVIMGKSAFRLRSERQSDGNGRVYGVTFKVTDRSGNATETACFFAVPHDASGSAAVDDGPDAGYTVP